MSASPHSSTHSEGTTSGKVSCLACHLLMTVVPHGKYRYTFKHSHLLMTVVPHGKYRYTFKHVREGNSSRQASWCYQSCPDKNSCELGNLGRDVMLV